jgi:hypothetical protein
MGFQIEPGNRSTLSLCFEQTRCLGSQDSVTGLPAGTILVTPSSARATSRRRHPLIFRVVTVIQRCSPVAQLMEGVLFLA